MNNILIVDDEQLNVNILIELLGNDYNLSVASNGIDTFEFLKNNKVDLILLDIMLTFMDGYEVCEKLKANPLTKNIPIIFLTSATDILSIQKAFEIGGIDYIAKPFNPIELTVRIKTHMELISYQQNLEKKVQQEIENNRKKNEILFQQNKMASMGEMIGSIAHQWRQPLAVINLNLAFLKKKNSNNNLSKEDLEKKIENMESNVQYMSQTIEDFLSFFNPNKEKEEFAVLDAINQANLILESAIKREDIKLFIEIENDLTILGYKKEYIQVILSILTNSIQAFKDIDNKQIDIKAYMNNDVILLEISDNAGGIPDDIFSKIFEPYFTTKHQSQGTGLGLYISKMIIEYSMNGKLDVKNSHDGAIFTIAISNGDNT